MFMVDGIGQKTRLESERLDKASLLKEMTKA